ncbi:PTH2-domain-containing protein [Athelia psychrophila]|uniref:peptidyl-tRNA hydrolase n=1 Tax=Athelia psychrophila TaxID=1759441 RepID=A0A166V010_9AGAM|nr:PTH2-domain-containing protein [Fibularhizoctonia sp. CBS 109695]
MNSAREEATYIALIVASLVVGYWAGARPRAKPTGLKESASDTSLPTQQPGTVSVSDDCKLVLVVRTDLGMSLGKVAAQCSHATLACYQTLTASNPVLVRQWERTGQTKIALKCDSEDELLLLEAKARSLNLCARSIRDAGRTQIAAGSRTVLGIGPAPARLINQVTGKLRLL